MLNFGYLWLDSCEEFAAGIVEFAFFAVFVVVAIVVSALANKSKIKQNSIKQSDDPFENIGNSVSTARAQAENVPKAPIQPRVSTTIAPRVSVSSHPHAEVGKNARVEKRFEESGMDYEETEGCVEHADERVVIDIPAYGEEQNVIEDEYDWEQIVVLGDAINKPRCKTKNGR